MRLVMGLFRDIGRFLEMGVIAHGHQFQRGRDF
jgi:hypothetical protein